jgi:hypothetical protein
MTLAPWAAATGDEMQTVVQQQHHCFYYPAVGQTVHVLAAQQAEGYESTGGGTFEAVVTAAPAEEVGMWGVRPLRTSTEGDLQGEQMRVHFSRLASRWGLPGGARASFMPRAAGDGTEPTRAASSVAQQQVRGLASERDKRPLIVIVGAGLGGLAAAAAMQRWGAHVQVYERDRSFGERKQGYGLTMQQGGAALRALGAEHLGHDCVSATLHASFASDGTTLGRYGHDTRRRAQQNDSAGSSPDAKRRKKNKRARNFLIPRQQLRQELLDLLEPGTVKWGHQFDTYELLPQGPASSDEVHGPVSSDGASWTMGAKVTARFSKLETMTSGTKGRMRECTSSADKEAVVKEHAAVLVGADGIFSRVAKQRVAADYTSLVYTGVLVVLGIVDYANDGTLEEQERLRDHELLCNGTTIAETVDGNARFCKLSPSMIRSNVYSYLVTTDIVLPSTTVVCDNGCFGCTGCRHDAILRNQTDVAALSSHVARPCEIVATCGASCAAPRVAGTLWRLACPATQTDWLDTTGKRDGLSGTAAAIFSCLWPRRSNRLIILFRRRTLEVEKRCAAMLDQVFDRDPLPPHALHPQAKGDERYALAPTDLSI